MKSPIAQRRPIRARTRTRPGERGFTMSEVLMSLVVFTVAVVGLVAMENRGIEAHRAAQELRGAERIAQQEMANLTSMGFDQLVIRDFADNPNPGFPYADDANTVLVRDFGNVPVDDSFGDVITPGVREDYYAVYRTISPVPATQNAPNGDPGLLDGIAIEVTVLWPDYSNPAFPPPPVPNVQALTPDMLDPGSAQFEPWVSGVQLRTVRINDGVGIQLP